MKNILKISAFAFLTIMANSSQATELVKVQPTNALEFLETAKLNLAQSIKLNTVAINPIEKAVRAQVTLANTKTEKRNNANVKIALLAE
jgi:uncharacterized protein YabE (DUF348 family)